MYSLSPCWLPYNLLRRTPNLECLIDFNIDYFFHAIYIIISSIHVVNSPTLSLPTFIAIEFTIKQPTSCLMRYCYASSSTLWIPRSTNSYRIFVCPFPFILSCFLNLLSANHLSSNFTSYLFIFDYPLWMHSPDRPLNIPALLKFIKITSL